MVHRHPDHHPVHLVITDQAKQAAQQDKDHTKRQRDLKLDAHPVTVPHELIFCDRAFQHITAADNGLDQWLLRAAVDLLAQLVHMYLNDIATRIEVDIPDLLEDLRFRHYLVRMADQVLEQRELPVAQIDPLTAPLYLPTAQVDIQVTHTDMVTCRLETAPLDRPDPGQHLIEIERLAHIINGPQIQRLDDLFRIAECAEH